MILIKANFCRSLLENQERVLRSTAQGRREGGGEGERERERKREREREGVVLS